MDNTGSSYWWLMINHGWFNMNIPLLSLIIFKNQLRNGMSPHCQPTIWVNVPTTSLRRKSGAKVMVQMGTYPGEKHLISGESIAILCPDGWDTWTCTDTATFKWKIWLNTVIHRWILGEPVSHITWWKGWFSQVIEAATLTLHFTSHRSDKVVNSDGLVKGGVP